jgi:hypothetical protein
MSHESPNKKKADAVEHGEVFDRVGLLVNEPPGNGRVALHLVIRLQARQFYEAGYVNAQLGSAATCIIRL